MIGFVEYTAMNKHNAECASRDASKYNYTKDASSNQNSCAPASEAAAASCPLSCGFLPHSYAGSFPYEFVVLLTTSHDHLFFFGLGGSGGLGLVPPAGPSPPEGDCGFSVDASRLLFKRAASWGSTGISCEGGFSGPHADSVPVPAALSFLLLSAAASCGSTGAPGLDGDLGSSIGDFLGLLNAAESSACIAAEGDAGEESPEDPDCLLRESTRPPRGLRSACFSSSCSDWGAPGG